MEKMTETDWREILRFSQRELIQADKEKLCESLSWMEADDIELNFTDLKTLFRLAQDILKFKNEQVNNLLGKIETIQRNKDKTSIESPTRSNDHIPETIAHQEEVIKANKEILEQLYADIAELEGRKTKLQVNKNNVDNESESSRDALSEMNAMAQLENEVALKNKHIRKLLMDIKLLEEDNSKLKEKVSVLKDKLTEATQLIENLTEQLCTTNNECTQLKEALGKSEQTKTELTVDIESLRKKLFEKEHNKENLYDEIKYKVQHWKNLVRSKKTQIESLSLENTKLKEELIQTSTPSSLPKRNQEEEQKIQELQDKLSEASKKILQSAEFIELLKSENKKLKSAMEETQGYSSSETKNESDDGKERINKLKRKIKNLSVALREAEELVAIREEELTEITAQLQVFQSDEGIKAILEGLKNKKKQLKIKDETVKSLVQELNTLNQFVNDIQLENEAMRQKLDIPSNEKISTKGILRKYRDIEQNNLKMKEEIRKLENNLIAVELKKHDMKSKMSIMTKLLNDLGCNKDAVDKFNQCDDTYHDTPTDGGGESSVFAEKQKCKDLQGIIDDPNRNPEIHAIIEENEGLRKGLQEILDFLKDNSTTSSGVLSLQCPSLEAVLRSMEARHAAGWFAPHMATVMELRAALGSRDSLLTALHEARKETFDVMKQLSKESEKSLELEQKLHEVEIKNKIEQESEEIFAKAEDISVGEFGTWMTDKEQININLCDKHQLENIITKGNALYEDQLKVGLIYFHKKFKTLYDKMTSIAIQTTDEQNKWTLQEEQYKAQIEYLKTQSYTNDEEDSDNSPGLIHIIDSEKLQRKCSYLEESYKYIRTLNENIKNEYLENKRDAMIMASKYEAQIQRLMISVVNLIDKLRNSISVELFWKQNDTLNETIINYRKIIDERIKMEQELPSLYKRLDNDKTDIINTLQKDLLRDECTPKNDDRKIKMTDILSYAEQMILQKQLEEVCIELNEKTEQMKKLEEKNIELQDVQSKIIDKTLSSATKEEVDSMKEQLQKLTEENKILKEQCQHVESQLDIALLQLQDKQQRQMNNDLEINMLKHQILDLQSSGDNKAIIARLSGEVLVSHLQASENYKRIERLRSALNKEKQIRVEAEEMLKSRQNIFDVYTFRYESKFRYMFEIMQILRQQYQGSLPLTSIENYLNNIEDLNRKTYAVNEKLDEIEKLRSNLIIKHSVYDQILDINKSKCLQEEDSCPHKLKYIVMQGIQSRELNHYNKKIQILEQSRSEIIKHCNYLEKTLVHVNQGFEKFSLNNMIQRKHCDKNSTIPNLELEDVQSDDETTSRKSKTITLPKPIILKQTGNNNDIINVCKENGNVDFKNFQMKQNIELALKSVQTSPIKIQNNSKLVQTEEDQKLVKLKHVINCLQKDISNKDKELGEAMQLTQQRIEDILVLNKSRISLESKVQILEETIYQKDKLNDNMQATIDDLRIQLESFKNIKFNEINKTRQAANDENKSLLLALKQLEENKESIIQDYKALLNNEREEYSKSIKDFNLKTMELQSQLDRRGSDSSTSNAETMNKYTLKIVELEDKCFRLQNELDSCKTELLTYQNEVDRWKNLASERLIKMEQLNIQLEERHSHEIESYKAENQHWLSQLNETQREHMDLRSQISEQKTSYLKQLADKDAHIEQLRSVNQNLKTQILNMQTMISINDPSFDLSAIVEVDEASDAMSPHLSSDKLELKFDSTIDLHDMQDDVVKMSASSTTIWHEPLIDRLRREKQTISKQNSMLRRQIKALAARERRARLDAQNLKNQVFRITCGGRAATAEGAALHGELEALRAQLAAARARSRAALTLWDKWKRAQQSSERWQSRFEEKSQEINKLEMSLNTAKSALMRLEKEKRVLLSKLAECKNEKMVRLEKREGEHSERSGDCDTCVCGCRDSAGMDEGAGAVGARALLQRVRAQQRRIVALEAADKGNEFLVSEYEKALAEITALKGQLLKLESALLESQIRMPLESTHDPQPELEYWKSYCEMVKQENVQLTMRVSALEAAPAASGAHQPRVADLERTVLTLRGLVSKLQAEQKSTGVNKRIDSRPSSGRSTTDKSRNQLETSRVEIANLKRSIHDKDLLLERSKEMLKIAAEREDELLRQNALLRRRLEELTKHKGGFLSA